MNQVQVEDKASVWEQVAKAHPEFLRIHDITENYHAVREIVLGGSSGWAGVHERFSPTRGSRVMDIGANAGIYSAFCAANGADVTAYEPYPAIFSLLSEMVDRANLLDHLTAINAAIWTHTGKCPYIGTTSSLDGACEVYNGGLQTEGNQWIPEDFQIADSINCVSFEDAIGDVHWDCIKMDIEGAEFEVLLRTPEKSLRLVHFMYVEFHPWASHSVYDETVRRLESIFEFEGIFRNIQDRWEAAYLRQ